MSKPLDGKVAIVTGASSGIGLAMAKVLAGAGAKVTITARDTGRLNALAAEIGESALPIAADLANPQQIEQMVDQTANSFGRIDILYANAGIFTMGPFEDSSPADISQMLRVNVEGVMHCTHAVLPHMRANATGDIVVVSSIAGVDELPDQPIYSASKHAVQTFVRVLRRQVGRDGIRVGAICPGTVATPLWNLTDPAEIASRVAERCVLMAEDVAEASLFMMTRPRHVTLRDVVILPQAQDI